MCYRFATNPSIHHHRHHIAAVSSPLSHYGVAFTSVAVSSLPSQCRLRHRIVTVLLSLSCHCGAFAVALLWFHRPHRSVAFVVALLWFRRRHHGVTFMFVAVLSLPSRCRLRCRIVAVSSSQLHSSAKINISYSILFNLTTSYSSYFGGKKGISRNKTSFFLLMNTLKRGVTSKFHNALSARHPGIAKTTTEICKYYWWPGIRDFITEYIKGCTTCQMNKVNTNLSKPPVYPITPAPDALPFQTIALDFITKLPESLGNDTILTITDHDCSKASIFIPCKEAIDSEGV